MGFAGVPWPAGAVGGGEVVGVVLAFGLALAGGAKGLAPAVPKRAAKGLAPPAPGSPSIANGFSGG